MKELGRTHISISKNGETIRRVSRCRVRVCAMCSAEEIFRHHEANNALHVPTRIAYVAAKYLADSAKHGIACPSTECTEFRHRT
jgi:hypothetical protein